MLQTRVSETDLDWDKVSLVTRSDYRQTAVESLISQPKTPSDIAEESGIEIAHISRSLKDLREAGIVRLLVAEDTKKGRIYGLSAEGEHIADHIRNNE